MNIDNIHADLHTHTTASDGTVEIDTRIRQAKEANLNAIAVTDHDTISPRLTSRRDIIEGIEVITGVEIKANFMGTNIEILGYYVNPTDRDLLGLLDTVREFRRERNDEIMKKLTNTTGVEVTRDTVPSTKGSIGRPHLAKYLVENDVVSSIQAAFDEYLADDADCFVPMEKANAKEVIEKIQAAGGVTSLAHPGRIASSEEPIEEIIAKLSETDLDGIEVWYPYKKNQERYVDIDAETAFELANKYDLLGTGGSDCHGPGSGKFRIGEVGVSSDQMSCIREQANQKRTFSD